MTDIDCHYFRDPRPGEVLVGLKIGGHDPLDSAIKFLTRGEAVHAFFIRGNDFIVENFYPHIHQRFWSPCERQECAEYRIAGSTPEDWGRLEHWFDLELRRVPPLQYSIVDLFRYAVHKPPLPGLRGFCSMFVLDGIRECCPPCKQPLARLQYRDYAPPESLRTSPLLIQRIKTHRHK